MGLGFLGEMAAAVGGDEGAGYGWLFLRMVIVLAGVIAFAILVLKYVLPRLGAIRGQSLGGQGIEIVARRALDPKRQLWIIKVGKRHFLLGSAESAVQCLAELRAEDLEGEKG